MRGTGTLAGAVRSFLALGIGNYGAMAAGLVVNALLARRLGADQYGRLALMLTASQVLLLLAVNWTHAGFIRFGAQEFAATGAASGAFRARLGLVVPATGLGLLVMILFREPLAGYLEIPPSAVWLIAVHFGAAAALSIAGAVLQAGDRMMRYGACLLLDKLAMLLCLLALPAAWTASPIRVLGWYAAGSLLVAVWGVSTVGLRVLRPALPTRDAFRQMLRFSAPLLLSSWAGLFGTNWFDLVILKWYVPMTGIGAYSLAGQLSGVIQQITIIFSTLLLPRLAVMVAEGQHEGIRLFVERMLPYWLLGTSVLFTLALIVAPVVVPLVFGPAFTEAVPVFAILMVATSALALFNACAPLVTAYGATWLLSGNVLVGAALNVVLDLVLIPRWGTVGSAMATAVFLGVAAAFILAYVQRQVGGRVLRLGWFSAPVALAAVSLFLVDGVWAYAAALATGGLSAGALAVAFRLFHSDDAVFLRQLHLPLPFGLGGGAPVGSRP